jgi:hypothetical protein
MVVQGYNSRGTKWYGFSAVIEAAMLDGGA